MKLTSLAIALCLVAPLLAEDTVTVYDFSPAVAAEGLRLHDEVERATKAFDAWKRNQESTAIAALTFSEDFKHAIPRRYVTANPCWGGGATFSSTSNRASGTVEGAVALLPEEWKVPELDPPLHLKPGDLLRVMPDGNAELVEK